MACHGVCRGPCLLPPPHDGRRSRWSCQWDTTCRKASGKKKCASILQTFGFTAAAISKLDRAVPIVLNGLGQNWPWEQCGGGITSMSWGDGFVTNSEVVQSRNVSDPSSLLTTVVQQVSVVGQGGGGGRLLAVLSTDQPWPALFCAAARAWLRAGAAPVPAKHHAQP